VRQIVKLSTLEVMLTTRQVADFLQVSICTIRRWSDEGKLKFYRVGSRGDRRYRREDVLHFLENPPTTCGRKTDAKDREVPIRPSETNFYSMKGNGASRRARLMRSKSSHHLIHTQGL